MKELFSAFSAAVFYPLVSLVLPGLTASCGWFVYFLNFPTFRIAVSQNHTETAFILMLLSVFVGTVIDDLGTRLESALLDRWRNARTKGVHREEWWAYLRKPFPTEPSGRRHLRKLVARLKFELGIPLGLLLTGPSIWLNPVTHNRWATLTSLLGGVLIVYLLIEAAATHEVLGELRHELLKEGEGIRSVETKKPVRSAQA